MNSLREQFVVDEKGNRISVLLDIRDYEQLLDALEELEEIRAYDRAKSAPSEVLPFDQAVEEIQSTR